MIISPKSGSSSPLSIVSPYKTPSRDTVTYAQSPDTHFDQVSISRDASVSDQFRKEWVSRLVKEVRTSHTANDISRIKSEVQSGSYQPDAREIASKILLEEHNRANF